MPLTLVIEPLSGNSRSKERWLARKKPSSPVVFSGRRNRDFVVLLLEALAQRPRDLLFVLNNQNTHGMLGFESCSRTGTIPGSLLP